MTRILSFDEKPFHAMSFANVDGEGRPIVEQLPFHRATVDSLPPGVEALVAASDLQGFEDRATGDLPPRLLGLALLDRLKEHSSQGLLPPLESVGIFLCGDLHALPDRRGGGGDAREVISAFSDAFKFTSVVLGNHDRIGPDPGNPKDLAAFRRQPGIHILDGDQVELGSLRIAGISGVIGKAGRLLRRSPEAFGALVGTLASSRPDVLLMHDGPDIPGTDLKGSPAIRQALEGAADLLVIRGHAHWDTPLVELARGVQVLSVDKRVVVMTASDKIR